MASANLYKHPTTLPPMPAVIRVLARFDRPKLEGFIAVALDLIDVMDGDLDVEPNGDEEDSTFAEDESGAELHARNEGGPGCTISDPAEEDSVDCEHDGAEIETWSHWLDHPAELHVGKRPDPQDAT